MLLHLKNEHWQFPFLPFVIAVASFVLAAYFSSLRSGCLRWKRVEPRCEFECGANYFHTVSLFLTAAGLKGVRPIYKIFIEMGPGRPSAGLALVGCQEAKNCCFVVKLFIFKALS